MPAAEPGSLQGPGPTESVARLVTVTVTLVLLHFLLRFGIGIGPAPDLLMVALLLAALRTEAGTGAGIGFAFGFLEDAFQLAGFGANAVAMTLCGILGAQARTLFLTTGLVWFHLVYFSAGAWVRNLIRWVLVRDAATGIGDAMFLGGLPAALYAGAAGVLCARLAGIREDQE